jgi:hypothetical protein
MDPRTGMNAVERRKYLVIAGDRTPVAQPVVCHILTELYRILLRSITLISDICKEVFKFLYRRTPRAYFAFSPCNSEALTQKQVFDSRARQKLFSTEFIPIMGPTHPPV